MLGEAVSAVAAGQRAPMGVRPDEKGVVLESAELGRDVRWRPGERLEQLFEEQCDRMDEAHLAVDAGDETLTYRQLDARANRSARYLLVGPARCGRLRRFLFASAQLVGVLVYAPILLALLLPVITGLPLIAGTWSEEVTAGTSVSFHLDALAHTAVLYAGGLLLGLALIVTVPRLLNLGLRGVLEHVVPGAARRARGPQLPRQQHRLSRGRPDGRELPAWHQGDGPAGRRGARGGRPARLAELRDPPHRGARPRVRPPRDRR
ncbi:hypothetical protein GCM10023320_24460 [Pseudonocardia adelaidensis]|uniref:Sensor protein n=1 Tax=Pseudonocardia adelaidensis TaxID=648754 RepID=A0ABP9NGM0_9PSEU